MVAYSDDTLKILYERVSLVQRELLEVSRGWQSMKLNEEASDYATHGVTRRCFTLCKCIQNIYKLCPPELSSISSDDLDEITIYLQAFIFNIFGALDNIAHVLNSELNLGIQKEWIGLGPKNKTMRNHLNVEFKDKLIEFDGNGWFEYIFEYRHALAHQIPLYVPPYIIQKKNVEKYNELTSSWSKACQNLKFDEADAIDLERASLGTFDPFFVHSSLRNPKRMLFHSQVLQDWGAIMVISDLALNQIKHKRLK